MKGYTIVQKYMNRYCLHTVVQKHVLTTMNCCIVEIIVLSIFQVES